MKSVICHCAPKQENKENNLLSIAKRTRVKGSEPHCGITDFTDCTDQVGGGVHV